MHTMSIVFATCLFSGDVLYSFSSAMVRYSGRYNDDMAFLNRRVWPQVKPVAYCHDSVSCRKFPSSFPFPVERRGAEHLGQRYDELSTGNRNDIRELQQAKVDDRCVPEKQRSWLQQAEAAADADVMR